MAQIVFTASNAAWATPADWNNADNSIEGIGGGGGGADNNSGNGGGGGGGEYRRANNQTLNASTNNNITIGAAGAGGTGSNNSTSGGFSRVQNSTPTTLMQANGGIGAQSTRAGGSGGTGAADSSNGGNGGGAGSFPGCGGGGAGGPNGVGGAGGGGAAGTFGGGAGGGGAGGGGNGADGSKGADGTAQAGGAGGTKFGGGGAGTAGTTAPTAGGNGSGGGGGGGGGRAATGSSTAGGLGSTEDGTTYTPSWGSSAFGSGGGGGAGSGGNITTAQTGRQGALYGGGGGGGNFAGSAGNGGAGAAGIVVVTYTPGGAAPIWGWEGQGAQFVKQQPAFGGGNKSRASAMLAGPIATFPSIPRVVFLDTFDDLWLRSTRQHIGGFLEGIDGIEGRFTAWTNAGWETQSIQLAHPRSEKSGAIVPKDDGTQAIFVPPSIAIWQDSWPAQPKRPRPERAGTILEGIDGIDGKYVSWRNTGWEIQSVQPKQPYKQRSALKHKLTAVSFPKWLNAGWEIQPSQPPHPRRERTAAVAPKDDGIQKPFITAQFASVFTDRPELYSRQTRTKFERSGALSDRDDGIDRPYIRWINAGWEVQPPQPPRRRHEKWPLADWDDGNYSIYAVWRNFGWEVQPWQPHRVYKQRSALKHKIIFTSFTPWLNAGWEVQSVQPPHRWIEKRGALMPREDGIENVKPFGLQTSAYPWHDEPWLYPRVKYERFGALADRDDGIDRPYSRWLNVGWEVQTPQPPHRKPDRSGGLLKGIDGIELSQVAGLQTASYPWYIDPLVYPRKNFVRYGGAIKNRHGFAIYSTWRNFGWEIQSVQPSQTKQNKSGLLARKFDGIETPIAAVLLTADYAWLETPWVYPKKNFAHWGAIAYGDNGNQNKFSFWQNSGWEIQAFQPPRRRYEKWPLADWDDGNYDRFNVWYNYGWPIQLPQPPHPKPERSGSIARGDDGNEGIKPFGLQTGDFAWAETPWVYPRVRFEHAGAIVPKEDGIERPFELWRNAGWEIQSPQPPRRKFERWAALARGLDGVPIAALLTAAYPWHDEPWIYPRRKPERWGSVARGDDGTQSRYERFINFGWPVQLWQPPRRRHELRGAIAPRDDGTQYTLLRFFNYGWPIQPWQPPHPKHLHQYIQDIGSYPLNLFQYVPPPPVVPPRRRSRRLLSLFFQTDRNVEVSDTRTNVSLGERNVGVSDVRANVQNSNIRRREDTDPSR